MDDFINRLRQSHLGRRVLQQCFGCIAYHIQLINFAI